MTNEQKTSGQKLYEHRHPTRIQMMRDKFGPREWVPNTEHVVQWRFLTKACQESYEGEAKTHFLLQNQKSTT